MKKYLLLVLLVLTAFAGCRQYDNFTTYFNTYYNANRLLKEVEDEFEFQDEKKRVKPEVVVPETKGKVNAVQKSGVPPFMNEFIIEQQKLQPVAVKIDSVIIKGSKILARHPKSDYVQGSLFVMAKAFFYRNDWINSQLKCNELIDRFPEGDMSPDAHLLLVENLLIQRKFLAGQTLLSRCVDIAWYKKRYDILSAAFRLEADLALYQNDPEGALKPYRQAIVQADDETIKAKWQLELSLILYRLNRFKESERMFAKVRSFSPDYLTEFESYVYQAESFARMGQFTECENIIKYLDNNSNYDEWKGNTYAAKMDLFRLQGKDKEFESASKTADSAYIGNPSIAAAYYEKGIDLFNKSQYINARKYFARTRTVKTPVYDNSDRMFNLINQWEQKSTNALPLFKRAKELNNLGDSLSSYMCQNLFELGRVHDQFGNLDSALYYYVNAAKYTPLKDTNSARYLYVYAKAVENDEPELADSLYELIVDRYPVTEFGVVARHIKGYTDNYVIDTVAELYKSGSSLRVNKEYRFAISQFLKIYDKYPTSVYAPRALYSIGWTFERDLKIQDTALIYYQLLMTKYPKSEYAKDISPSVMYLIAVKDGRVPKDTGNVQQAKINKGEAIKNDTTKLLMDKNKINQKPLEANKPGSVNTRQLDAKSVISNPNEVLKNLQDKAKDPNSYIPDIKINNPFGGWNKLKDTTTVKPDTTKIK